MERLSSNYVFNTAIAGVTKNRSLLVEQYEKIASGQQINKASDDPVLAARILDMQRNISNIEQSDRYSITAINDLATEEAVLTQVQSLMLRARTLVLQGSNDTNGAGNKQIVGGEVNELLDQIAVLSNSQTSEGAYIFSGYKADSPSYSFVRDAFGNITSAVYDGDNNTVEKNVSSTLRVAVSHPGSQVFSNASGDLFQELIDARDSLLAGNSPTNLAQIDAGYDHVTQAITDVGTRTNLVESTAEVNALVKNTLEKSLGSIRDLDLPTAITHFTQLETTVQAINNTFAKISSITLFDYL